MIAGFVFGWLLCTAVFVCMGWRAAKIRTPKPPHVTTQTDWWIATAKAAHKRRSA